MTKWTLAQLNQASKDEALQMLDGLYEHSLWIAEGALSQRPFSSMQALKEAMISVLNAASHEAKLALLRAHPELAGKAMETQSLTAESTNEQNKAGLTQCTPEELAHIRKLNQDYSNKFGWPFILAVRGPTGNGLTKNEIISIFEQRLNNETEPEFEICLKNIHRIVELRLQDKSSDH